MKKVLPVNYDIYLCSRVRAEARPLNDEVANALEKAGYKVYVPHRQSFNNEAGSSDEEIFTQDMSAMLGAKACVIVGKIGVDCGFEAGWFNAKKIPTIWYQKPGDERHPMFFEITGGENSTTVENLYALVDMVETAIRNKPPTLFNVLMGYKP